MEFLTTVTILLLYGPIITHGLVTLDHFYPFGSSADDFEVYHCDDCSTNAIPLEKGFPFFGKNRTSIYVSSNGMITTNGPITEYVPIPFPVSNKNYQMVAPFWADIDVRGSGNIFYRSSTNETLLSDASYEIQHYFPSLAQFQASFAFVVTYYKVPYYSYGNLYNTFQCILLTDYSNSVALYLYENVTWTYTSSQGHYHAEVGFDSGDGEHYYKVKGSLTSDIKSINNRSNVGVPGKWAFRIDGKNVSLAVLPKVLSLKPESGLAEGGYSINLTVSGLPNTSIHYSYFCRQFHYNKYVDTLADRIDTETLTCQLAGIPFAGGYEMRIEAGVSINHLEWVSDSYKRFRFWTCDEIDCGAHGVCHSGQCNCTLPYIGSYCKHEVKWPYIPDNKFELNLCELVDTGSLNLTVLAGQSPFDWSFQSDAIPPWLKLESVSNFSAKLTWTRPTFEFLYLHPIKITVSNKFGKSIVTVDIKLLQAYDTVISNVSPEKVLHLQPIYIYGRLEALPQCNLSTLSQTAIIWLMHHNHTESFLIQSDTQGVLSYHYNPSERDVGNFSVILTHPFIKPVNRSEVTIEIILLLIDVKTDHIAVQAGDQFNGTLAVLRNPNHRALTGITAQITLLSGAGNPKIQADDLSFPSMLESDQSATLMLNTTFAPQDSGTISFAINITTDIGAYATIMNIQVIVSMRVVEIVPDFGLAEGGYAVTLMVYGLLTGYNNTYFCRQYHHESYVDTTAKYINTENISCQVAGIPLAAGYNMRIEAGAIRIDHGDLSVSNSNKKFHFLTCQQIDCGPHGLCYSGKCNCTLPYTGSFCDQLVKWPYIPKNSFELSLCELDSVGSLTLTLEAGEPPFEWSFVSVVPKWLFLMTISNVSAELSWLGPTFDSVPPQPLTIQVKNIYGKSYVILNITLLQAYETHITAVSPMVLYNLEPVSIYGRIMPLPDCNLSTVGQSTELWVFHNDHYSFLDVYSNTTGIFQSNFMPNDKDVGNFSLWATHPSMPRSESAEASFQIVRLYIHDVKSKLNVQSNSNFTGVVAILENPNDQYLTGIQLHIRKSEGSLDLEPSNLDLQVELEPRQTSNISLSLEIRPHQTGNNVFLINITTAQGCNAEMKLEILVYSRNPQLEITPTRLDVQVTRGGSKVIPLVIENTGGEDAIRPMMPIPAGIIAGYRTTQLVHFSDKLPTVIKAGKTVQLSLTINIPASVALDYKMYLSFDLSWSLDWEDTTIFNAIFTVNVVVVSDVLVTMTVHVKDEFSYFAKGKPLLSDATVTVFSMSDTFQAEKVTNHTGTVMFRSSEGYYLFHVKAPKHKTAQLGPVLATEYQNTFSVFLSRQGISYTWGAHKNNITDKYNMTLKPHFKTDVPMPVVTIAPNPIPLRQLVRDNKTTVAVTLTNVGLIDALDVKLNYPKNIPGVTLENNDTLAKLPAKSSAVFQVNIVVRENHTAVQLSSTGCGSCLGHYGWGYVCDLIQVTKTGYQLIDYDCSKCPIGGDHGEDSRSSDDGDDVDDDDDDDDDDGDDHGDDDDGKGHRGEGSIVDGGDRSPRFHYPVNCIAVDSKCAAAAAKGLFTCLVCDIVPEARLACQVFGCLDSILSIKSDIGDRDPTKLGADVMSAFCDCSKYHGKPCPGSGESSGKNRGAPGGPWQEYKQDYDYNVLPKLERSIIDWCELSKFIPYAKFLPIPGIGCIPDAWDVAKTCFPNLDPCASSSYKGYNSLGNGQYMLSNSHAMVASMSVPRYYFGSYFPFESLAINDTTWLDVLQESLNNSSKGGQKITREEMKILLDKSFWNNTDTALKAEKFLQRYQKSITLVDQGITPDGTNGTIDFLSIEVLNDIFKAAVYTAKQHDDTGPFMAYSGQLKVLKDSGTKVTKGVCAEVTLQIDQQLTLVRQAVNASLTVHNDQIGIEVSQIDAKIEFREDQINHNERFSIERSVHGQLNPPEPHGPYSLGPGQSGRIDWEAIPYREAAPFEDVIYKVAGNLSYTMDNSSVVIPLMPIPITISPEPELFINYFYQREVYGDDPFTRAIEPSIPFLLAVFIGNGGYGPAYGMTLSSTQPRIIENKKGLLVSFKIIGAELDNKTITPSFSLVRIGTVEPITSAVVQYWLTSSLMGNFTSFNLTVVHNSLHGDPKLSLINSSSYHQLIKDVTLPGIDNYVPSMLCADHPDLNPNPDSVYSSINGTIKWSVCSYSGTLEAVKGNASLYKMKARIAMFPGQDCPFFHISGRNPLPNQEILHVARSDDSKLENRNYWKSYSGLMVNMFDMRFNNKIDVVFMFQFSNHKDECGSHGPVWLEGCETCYCISGTRFCTQTWSSPKPCTNDQDCPSGMQCTYYQRTTCIKYPCIYRNYCIYNQTANDDEAKCGRDNVTCSFLPLRITSETLENDTNAYDVCLTLRIATLNMLGEDSPCLEMQCTQTDANRVDMRIAIQGDDEERHVNSSDLLEMLENVITEHKLLRYLVGVGNKVQAIGKSISIWNQTDTTSRSTQITSTETLKTTEITTQKNTKTTATSVNESTTSYGAVSTATYPISHEPVISTQGPTSKSTTEETPTTTNTPKPLADDCGQLLKWNQSTSGIYNITFGGLTPNGTAVYCDQESDEGGWTVFQRRVDGNTDFDQEWKAYTVDGIGRAHEGNYWIPLAVVANYSQQRTLELRIDIWDCFGRLSYEVYKQFEIGTTTYNISVSNPMGTAGDSFNSPNYGKQFIQNGTAFTTKDKDHDNLDKMNCADFYKGGWWFNECGISNLNGQYKEGCYYTSVFANGIIWSTWNEASYSAFKTEMKFRIVE